jgi:hypothetical protein
VGQQGELSGCQNDGTNTDESLRFAWFR